MSQPTVVLFLTHVWGLVPCLKFERLRREIGKRADVFVLLQQSPGALQAMGQFPPDSAGGPPVVAFDPDKLAQRLGIPLFQGPSLVPGSTHYPVLAFAASRPQYRNLLVIEFDVDFTGNWGALLDHLLAMRVDFASTHLRSKPEVPDWFYWPTLEPAEADREWAADPANLRRSFNPVYFIKRRALGLVLDAHRAGWRGHYECLVPTILAHHGCKTLDFADGERLCRGTEQEWAEGQAEGALSTMRWRPAIKVAEFAERAQRNTLFHPIKRAWYFDGKRLVRPDREPRE